MRDSNTYKLHKYIRTICPDSVVKRHLTYVFARNKKKYIQAEGRKPNQMINRLLSPIMLHTSYRYKTVTKWSANDGIGLYQLDHIHTKKKKNHLTVSN